MDAVPAADTEVLPMVGLGGSAGSIAALREFFTAMPVDSGMAFVVILHLSPEHESTLAEMFQRSTAMPVVTAKDGAKVEANCVYVIPPGKLLSSANGRLRLTKADHRHGRRVAVDVFFRTLADTHGAESVAVVFSGADGDGALGLKRIKERGGLTIAQDPDEAEHPGMPRSAIATGMVDWVLPVKEIPARLMAYVGRRGGLKLPAEEGPHPAEAAAPSPNEPEAALRDVLAFLHTRTARDFSYYKRATILRRIARRMQVNGLDDLPGYLAYLRTHAGEAGALLQDLLISVTNFFRDPDSFTALERIVPDLFKDKGASDTVRVWVAGCATGEEAYSIAMLLCEHARSLEAPPQLQVFATDLDEDVIRDARDGIYPATIATDVSEERLRRFFIHEHGGYRVRREVREIVLFAPHDLLKDSPFSRLDLISCRNLLIYLNREAQLRAFDIFHFALRPGGHLFLGTSETVDEGSPRFAVVDKKQRLYVQRPGPRQVIAVPAGPGTLARALALQERTRERPTVPGRVTVEGVQAGPGAPVAFDAGLAPGELHYRLIERFSPPSILVSAAQEIVHLSESAGRFLQFAGGEPTRNLLRAVHPMLRIELRAALYAAAQTHGEATAFRVPVETGDERSLVDIRVTPAGDLAPDFLLVVFEAHPPDGRAAAAPASAEADQVARHLERELEATKAHLRDTIEESEASTEELKASNEELQAMNEELRSATEELETSREELQSINEELTTVNDELKNKVEQLAHANSDLQNLMSATAIATVFLDRDLRIMRYTPPAVALFNLIPSDIGRPLTDLTHRLHYPEIVADAGKALARLTPAQREVRADGNWYLARALPYRTAEDRIAGVVLTFTDITDLKQAGEALRASAEQLRLIADTAPVFIAHCDREFRYKFVNEPYAARFGLRREEVIGRHLAEVMGDAAYESIRGYGEQVLAGEAVEFEVSIPYEKLGMHFMRCAYVPERGANGEVVGFIAAIVDITDRKRAEEAAARLAAIVKSSDDAIIGKDLSGIVTSWNAGAERMFGYPASEMLGQSILRIIPPERHHEEARILELVQSGEGHGHFETVRVRKDGGTLEISLTVSPIKDAAGKVIGASKVARDITERKRAAEALRESEERFRLLADNAPVLVWVNGPDGCEFVNRVYRDFLGVGSDVDVMSFNWAQFVHPDDRERYVADYLDCLARRAPFEAQFRFRRHDGVYRWMKSSGVPRLTAKGEFIGYIGSTADIDDVKRAEEESRAAKEAAEAANQSKDRFLAVLSHELRTPLTPVLMAVGALEHDPELRPDVREDLVMIKRNIELETKLIDDLLDLNRIASGKLALKTEAVDLNEAVRQVCGMCRAQLLEQNVRLETDFAADAGPIAADPARLQQVIWNVLKNAIKFTPGPGTVRVSTTRPVADRCEVRVCDSGIGISPEVLPRIFDAFEQGDAGITRQFGGLGLGLAICKALVEMHGGTIRAESAGPGQGSTFTIVLPGQPAAPAGAPEATPPPGEVAKKIRLLVVEDHADTAATLARSLRRAGLAVTCAGSVAAALAAAERETFDVLVSDIGLPDGTGCDLMQRMRAMRQIPGIAMSGYGMDEDVRRSREAGFTEHLVKPIEVPLLIAAIRRVTTERLG